MDYKDILENIDPSTKMHLDKVKRFLSAGKASVMIGSGFSLNAENDGTGKMRDWNALNVDLYKSLYGKEPSKEELIGLNPIRLASQVEATHGKKELDEVIMNALPDKSVYPGSLHKKLMKLHWRDVFTTNYDTLLERSCDESGSAYTLVTSKETLLYSKSPRIVKLHGSFPNVRPFIMSEEHFRTYPEKYPEFVNTVRQSLIENLFCLIGFSGNDPNFLSWLGWIRDVMGEQMTNAVLVTYKKAGVHISEKQFFASRKIDILNLAEIKNVGDHQEALDFFLTYIGHKDEVSMWTYPSIDHFHMPGDKKEPDFKGEIDKMIKARNNYPGWVYMPERIVLTCGINKFPFLEGYYSKVPDEYKLAYLYELDWLLDMCLYPKNADWYLSVLEEACKNYNTYKSEEKVKARQLIVSLSSIYRDLRMLDEYTRTSKFIEENFFDELTTKQRSVFYYDRCLWHLAIFDYKIVYSTLLNWRVQSNDFLGALWQASVYAELGDKKMAEDMLVSFYSRLTTKMLQEDKSEFLSTCRELYAYVIPRTVARDRRDFDFEYSNSVAELKRKLSSEAIKKQPRHTDEHGFNIDHVTNSTHMHQGGFVPSYLNPFRYIRLSYLHGNTSYLTGGYDRDEYARVLRSLAKHHLYQAIGLTIRSGNNKLVESVVCRENLSQIKSDEVSVIFADLFELLKESFKESNRNGLSISYSVLLPIIQRLCTRGSDENINDLFNFVLEHSTDGRIQRNDILETIYKSASKGQREMMYVAVMNTPISLDSKHNDIIFPEVRAKIEITDNILSNIQSYISKKDRRNDAYSRLLSLLDCDLNDDGKKSLQDIIVNWRAKECKDINALYSYHVVHCVDEQDAKNEKKWIADCVRLFLEKDFVFEKSSEVFCDFTHFVGNLIPAIYKLSDEDIEKVLRKICDTLVAFYPTLKNDDSEELMGGFRHFSNMMFSEVERVFTQIDFNKVKIDIKQDLTKVLLDYLETHHPCLLLLCLIQNDDIDTLAASASNRLFSRTPESRFDAMRSLFYLFKNNEEKFDGEKSFKYIQSLVYYLKYSQSKNIIEYIRFLRDIASEGMIANTYINLVFDALLEIHNHISEYDLQYEFKLDIVYHCCELAGVLSTFINEPNAAISAWKKTSDDSEEFRDVRLGFAKGVELVENTH